MRFPFASQTLGMTGPFPGQAQDALQQSQYLVVTPDPDAPPDTGCKPVPVDWPPAEVVVRVDVVVERVVVDEVVVDRVVVREEVVVVLVVVVVGFPLPPGMH
jgi:hypothetical protein